MIPKVCDRLAFTLEEALQFFSFPSEDTLVCRHWTGALREVNNLEEATSFFQDYPSNAVVSTRTTDDSGPGYCTQCGQEMRGEQYCGTCFGEAKRGVVR